MIADARIAMVTGAGSGIGEGIARELADAGYRVAVCDVDATRGPVVAGEIGGIFVHMDVTTSAPVVEGVSAIEAQLGPIDVLVNCAGADVIKPFLETDETLWEWLIQLNLIGVFRTCRVVAPGMIERGSGRIINISSDAGRVGSTGEAAYSGAKGGVIAFSKTLAREVASGGVTVNVVCPGPTDTPALRKNLESGGQEQERIIAGMTRGIPLKRLGLPSDIATAVRFFASEPAGFVTGQTLSVSGGLTMV